MYDTPKTSSELMHLCTSIRLKTQFLGTYFETFNKMGFRRFNKGFSRMRAFRQRRVFPHLITAPIAAGATSVSQTSLKSASRPVLIRALWRLSPICHHPAAKASEAGWIRLAQNQRQDSELFVQLVYGGAGHRVPCRRGLHGRGHCHEPLAFGAWPRCVAPLDP